jgi:hypothetical protein
LDSTKYAYFELGGAFVKQFSGICTSQVLLREATDLPMVKIGEVHIAKLGDIEAKIQTTKMRISGTA